MTEQQFFKEKQESNIFVQLIQKYLPFWPLFALTIPIAVSIAYIYLRAEIPIYIATAKVLLKDPNKGSGDSKVLDALNIFSEKKIVENEILVLRSSGLMVEVVKTHDLYATLYNQGKVRLEELYGENSPIRFVAQEKDSIYSWGKYPFKIHWAANRVEINNQQVPFNGTILLDNVHYQLVMNRHYNTAVLGKNYYVITRPVAAAAGEIIGSLRASPLSSSSTVLDIKLETPVPEKAKDILQRLFEVYNTEGIQDKNQIAAKTLAFIDDRMNYVTHQLDSVEQNIEAYKNRESLYSVGTQGELFLTKVRELDIKKGEVGLQLEILEDVKNYVLRKGKKTGTVPSLNLITDPTLATLLNSLYTAEFDLESLLGKSGESSEPVLLATAKISRLKSDILENITNIRNNLVVVRNDVGNNIARNNNLLKSVPQKERGLLEISRQQEIKTTYIPTCYRNAKKLLYLLHLQEQT